MYQIVKSTGQKVLTQINNKQIRQENLKDTIFEIIKCIEYLKENTKTDIYGAYEEFFLSFEEFCINCIKYEYFSNNMEIMKSTLEVFLECVEEIIKSYEVKKCMCCNKEVIYAPISKYYSDMQSKHGTEIVTKSETLNKEEYLCPRCGSSDRDRLIISFLDKNGLQKAAEGAKILQFAPANAISNWIETNCPHLEYHTTDLYMDDVTFKSDIQNISMVEDNTYDLIICSHVLEHVQDDQKAMTEMKRILKPEGKIVFLVPIDLNQNFIDEEWGLTEEENWRRFGQGDHCRRYCKKGLLERLNKYFYVNHLGKEYFGEDVFRQCGLLDSSVLYVLTKSEEVSLSLEEDIIINEKLCNEGPLVSVILSCYNHEEFVAEAIESVINQSYKNIEILVADDASTDNTASVMKRYSKYFTKEFYFENNAGGRSNFLVQQSSGKYIALMHSDDAWDKDKIALQVEYLENHPEVEICLTWCKYIDENAIEINDNTFIKSNRDSYEWMNFFWKNGNALCNPSSVMRVEVYKELQNYGLACRQLPDFFKWVYAVQRYSIYVIPKVLIKMKRYQKKSMENTSFPTKINYFRHLNEEGANWIWIIRNMKKDYFKRAFSNLMINPDADTEEEIKCEKYFLILNHHNMFVQNSAYIYISEVYDEISLCMKEKYNYYRKDIALDMMNKGLGKIFI